MRIHIAFGRTTLTAALNDTQAARDLIAQLPLTLAPDDLNSAEKIARLPAKLSTTGAPTGTAAKAGDVDYYSPWGALSLFYRDFPYAAGLAPLGHIDGPIDALAELPDGTPIEITIAD